MRKERTTYSKEFKIKAVELVEQKGNLSLVSRELNIGDESLRKWCREHKAGILKGTTGVKVKSKEEEEIIRLKKALYESNLERDILKKAVSIFSKNDR
jgi:transposase